MTYWALKEIPLGQEEGAQCIKKGKRDCALMHREGDTDPKDKNQTNYVAPFGNAIREKRGVTR